MRKLAAIFLLLFPFSAIPAPNFVAIVETEITSGNATWNCDVPGGTSDGHVMLIVMNTNSVSAINTAPANTDLLENPTSGDSEGWLYTKTAASEGATLQFVFAAAETGHCIISTYSGVTKPTASQSDSAGFGVVGSVSGPSVDTTGTDGALIVQIVGQDPGTVGCTDDTSPDATERIEATIAGGIAFTCLQDYVQPSAGAIALDYTGLAGIGEWWGMQVWMAPTGGSSGLLRRRRQ